MMTHHASHPPGRVEKSVTSPRRRPKLHKDWRTWLAVGLMLGAMAMYVLTLDDAVQPGSESRATISETVPKTPPQ